MAKRTTKARATPTIPTPPLFRAALSDVFRGFALDAGLTEEQGIKALKQLDDQAAEFSERASKAIRYVVDPPKGPTRRELSDKWTHMMNVVVNSFAEYAGLDPEMDLWSALRGCSANGDDAARVVEDWRAGRNATYWKNVKEGRHEIT